jgi:hypothetical protein
MLFCIQAVENLIVRVICAHHSPRYKSCPHVSSRVASLVLIEHVVKLDSQALLSFDRLQPRITSTKSRRYIQVPSNDSFRGPTAPKGPFARCATDQRLDRTQLECATPYIAPSIALGWRQAQQRVIPNTTRNGMKRLAFCFVAPIAFPPGGILMKLPRAEGRCAAPDQ